MARTDLDLPDGYFLSSIALGDEHAFVDHLADGEVARVIPVLPHPYGHEEALGWIRYRQACKDRVGVETTFAVRRPDGYLVGSVGVDDYPFGAQDHAELGYWLAPSERGHGLATAAVLSFVRYAFPTLMLRRIDARTLSFNRSSMRVLEKAGFRHIETRPSFTRTREGMFDTLFYELERDRCPDAVQPVGLTGG